MPNHRVAYRICTLCEATCGIAVEVEGDRIIGIRGDKQDPFSKGYICPKAYGLKGIHEDGDRMRRPLRKTAGGGWETISWADAYRQAGERLAAIRERHGPNAVAMYIGNPSVHSLHTMVYVPIFSRALGGKQRFSASTVDQVPKMLTALLMFGDSLSIPVPDLDRTEHLLIFGANPMTSNGSLMTAPNVGGRLRAIRERGGKVVVIDPRRTETARMASEHVFIRPGTDAYLLLAMVNVMFAERLDRLGHLEEHVRGLDAVRAAVAEFSPEAVVGRCGVDPATVRRLTRELCAAGRAACYGRTGTTCASFGTLASWALDVVNIVSGHLDRPGGAMFTRPAALLDGGSSRRRPKLHRWKSRVRGLPEVFGELPVATLTDEIETPGEGQIRALVTIAGNPVVSTPDAARLDRALASLDFMVSIDFYRNETTRHADLILPPTDALEHDTYDLALYRLAVRNVAKYSQPVFAKQPDAQHDWEILACLSGYLMGMGKTDPKTVDDLVLQQLATKVVESRKASWEGLTLGEALQKLADGAGPHRLLDLLLRTGTYGDGFGRRPGGLCLERLMNNPHGIDLGPLDRRIPDVLRTESGRIDLAPDVVMNDLARLRAESQAPVAELVLIGRRDLRSNNSWCHNLPALMKGNDRCTLLVSPEDASRLRLDDGSLARVTSRAGSVVAPVVVSDEMMPGVVSLPHGWGHDADGLAIQVASAHPGVNSNVLTNGDCLDAPTGNAVLNGIPVTITVPA